MDFLVFFLVIGICVYILFQMRIKKSYDINQPQGSNAPFDNIKNGSKEVLFCSNCGNQYGENNNFCNNCGKSLNETNLKQQNTAKTNKINSSSSCFGCLAIIVIFIVILAIFGNSLPKDTVSSQKSDAQFYCDESIKNILKAPSTAKFPDILGHEFEDLGNNTWKVTSYVDSQNGFGAMIRTHWICKAKVIDEYNVQIQDIKIIH